MDPRLRGDDSGVCCALREDTTESVMHPTPPALPVEALLKPRAIALVGVSPKGGAGANILRSGQRFGYAVPTWPVNPNYDEIAGHRCFKSLKELPSVPDCVVVSLPADAVLGVVDEAAALGVRGVYVVSEGFADAASDEGRARQAALTARARAAGIALAGPNCMGITSFGHGFAATMADIPKEAAAGGISLVSQSGGLMNSFAELTTNRGIGVNYLVSSGNEAVLEMADYIEFLADDPATRVIACIMEGAKNGRRFRAAVERAARKRLRAARDACPYRHACRPARGVRGAVPAERGGAGRFDRRAGRDRGIVRRGAAAARRPRRHDDGVGWCHLADRRPRRDRGAELPAHRRGHQHAGAADPRRRARLRQSARHRRPAAPA
jgi:predicted CoA-binding protein